MDINREIFKKFALFFFKKISNKNYLVNTKIFYEKKHLNKNLFTKRNQSRCLIIRNIIKYELGLL